MVAAVFTAGWAIALIVLLILGDSLPSGSRWWIWTCATGTAMGLFGLWYVPRLKRGRAEAATRRSEAAAEAAKAAPDAPAPPPEGLAGAAGERLEHGLLDRDARQVHQVVTELVDHRNQRAGGPVGHHGL